MLIRIETWRGLLGCVTIVGMWRAGEPKFGGVAATRMFMEGPRMVTFCVLWVFFSFVFSGLVFLDAAPTDRLQTKRVFPVFLVHALAYSCFEAACMQAHMNRRCGNKRAPESSTHECVRGHLVGLCIGFSRFGRASSSDQEASNPTQSYGPSRGLVNYRWWAASHNSAIGLGTRGIHVICASIAKEEYKSLRLYPRNETEFKVWKVERLVALQQM